jgi:transcriptional regulator with XRE-family HTH domain
MSDQGDAPMANDKPASPTALAAKATAARKERGMTQGQLAERLHVRQSMLSMFETGEENVSEELAGRIRAWIDSGAGPTKKSPRGPYKVRSTIPK